MSTNLLEQARRAASVDLDAARAAMERWTQYEQGSLMRRWAAARIRAGGTDQDRRRLAELEASDAA